MLVKLLILILSISFTLAYDRDSINKIFENLIKQKFNQIDVNRLDNPFEKIDLNISKHLPYNSNEAQEVLTKEKVVPKLQVIFNNSAKLEDKWYKEGDEVFGFKIVEIKENYVILKDNEKEENLSLVNKKEIVRTSDESY